MHRLMLLFLAFAVCGAAGGARDAASSSQASPAAAPQNAPSVYVVFWFDTEDYLTPASDDAALRLAGILGRYGARGTFKLTGEKARMLEKRGRRDVIEALRRHDIGYHTDFHSVPPAPAAYLDRLPWDEGVEEFYRREESGARDLARILARPPSCYGQPGNSWAPQTYPALRRMHIPVYLDSGRHINLDDDMFWYGGMLNFFSLGKKETRLKLGENYAENLARANADFDAIVEDIRKAGGPGNVISIVYHPWEFVESKAWDAVNFAYGANPPRAQWQPAPLKSREESEREYENFARYVADIAGRPGVRFATASDLIRLYPDAARGRAFTRDEVTVIARGMTGEVSWWRSADGTVALTAAEVFSLMLQALDPARTRLRAEAWGGPRHAGRTTRQAPVPRQQLLQAAADTLRSARHSGYVPGEIWLGPESVTPADFMAAVARALADGAAREVPLVHARFLPAAHAAQDSPNLWGWLIHPKGMTAPNVMQLAALQTWTLKPALLTGQLLPRRRAAGNVERPRPAALALRTPPRVLR